MATQTVGAPPALDRLRDAVLLVDEVRADQLVGFDLARDVRVDPVDQELDDVLVPAQARRLQRVVAEVVADQRIGPVPQQQLHRVRTALAYGVMQRDVTRIIPLVHADATVDQELAQVGALYRVDKTCAAVDVRLVDISAVFDEVFDDVDVRHVARRPDGRRLRVRGRVDLGAVANECADDRQLVGDRRAPQRRHQVARVVFLYLVDAAHLDVGAALIDEVVEEGQVAVLGGDEQRGDVVRCLVDDTTTVGHRQALEEKLRLDELVLPHAVQEVRQQPSDGVVAQKTLTC